MTTVTIIGLGEAGALYARGLRGAGFTVSGFDPYARLDDAGIVQHSELADAVSSAELAISLVGARAAQSVAEQALPNMTPGSLYADFNTASPELKAKMADAARAAGVAFADVAVLAPVPRNGAKTPLMASGAGAEQFVELMGPTGADLESIGGEPGDAAGRKLLRSVFMKGLAAVVIESTAAAQKAGQLEWLRAQIASELSADPYALIDRLISGSRQHAGRRVHETEDAATYLESLAQPNWATQAAHAWLSKLRDEHVSTQGL